MTTTDEDEIIAKLKTDAKAGSVQAAKELREWLRACDERGKGALDLDTATAYDQLSEAQRLELRARLLREALIGEGAQAPVQAPE